MAFWPFVLSIQIGSQAIYRMDVPIRVFIVVLLVKLRIQVVSVIKVWAIIFFMVIFVCLLFLKLTSRLFSVPELNPLL